MASGNFLTPTKNFLMEPFRLFPDLNRMMEEPLTMLRPMLPLEENYWPMKPWTPACDIFETDTELVLKFELPEVNKEDVKVTMENHVLTLRGERKFEEETNRENYHRVERRYGEFMRSFNVPMFVDATKIKAEFKHGLLTVTLPKREEARATQIEVKVN
ncbi:MAG TPA: Hsp20/alpha crystallin family protein [Pyrinomonadaceae bacterium]|nr:Hsp20/alpha crystallin family protein [Pyrinomonadaceae bacterium]